MSATTELLDSVPPETDPTRRGWQVLLAVAWSIRPAAALDVLVDLAVTLAGPLAEADRDVVEQVALEMLVSRGEAANRCR